jgi:uncharacterized DUF497 family protein
MYIMEWEWDDEKNNANIEKHGIAFEEALSVFTDPDGIEKEDLQYSSPTEQRRWRTGRLSSGQIVTVVYALRENNRRLISAQERRRERREDEKAKREKKP